MTANPELCRTQQSLVFNNSLGFNEITKSPTLPIKYHRSKSPGNSLDSVSGLRQSNPSYKENIVVMQNKMQSQNKKFKVIEVNKESTNKPGNKSLDNTVESNNSNKNNDEIVIDNFNPQVNL